MTKYVIRTERIYTVDKPHYLRLATPMWCSNWTRILDEIETFRTVRIAELRMSELPSHYFLEVVPLNLAQLDLVVGIN